MSLLLVFTVFLEGLRLNLNDLRLQVENPVLCTQLLVFRLLKQPGQILHVFFCKELRLVSFLTIDERLRMCGSLLLNLLLLHLYVLYICLKIYNY